MKWKLYTPEEAKKEQEKYLKVKLRSAEIKLRPIGEMVITPPCQGEVRGS